VVSYHIKIVRFAVLSPRSVPIIFAGRLFLAGLLDALRAGVERALALTDSLG
jgi:hypothetical protein